MVRAVSTYEALIKEFRRLRRTRKGLSIPSFFEEYVYGHLGVLDMVALVGGRPISVLQSDEAATLLEHPVTKTIMVRILALMQVSEDWETFEILYNKAERP